MQSKFILLDTETTGTTEKDRICQLAFLLKQKGQTPKIYNDYCKPELPISFEAMSVNHITNEMVANKPICKETKSYKILEELNLPENVLIVHNAPFDLAMLEKEGFVSKMQLIDTYRCAKTLFENLNSYALQFLRYALELYNQETKNTQAHDALGDVLVLDLLMNKIIKSLDTEQDKIEHLIKLTKKPILIKKFNFGKYKDSLISFVAKTDKDYIKWLLEKTTDTDLKYSLEIALND